jgi:hypothetical protein
MNSKALIKQRPMSQQTMEHRRFNGKIAATAYYTDYKEEELLFDNSAFKTWTSLDNYGKKLLNLHVTSISKHNKQLYNMSLYNLPEEYRPLFSILEHLYFYDDIAIIKLSDTDTFTDELDTFCKLLSSEEFIQYMFRVCLTEIDQLCGDHSSMTTNGLFKLMLNASKWYVIRSHKDITNPNDCELQWDFKTKQFNLIDSGGNIVKSNVSFKTNLIIDVYVAGYHNVHAKENIKDMDPKLLLSSFDSFVKTNKFEKQTKPTVETSDCKKYKVTKTNNRYIRLESDTFWLLYKVLCILLNTTGEKFYDEVEDRIVRYDSNPSNRKHVEFYRNQVLDKCNSNGWYKIPDLCFIVPMGLVSNWKKPTNNSVKVSNANSRSTVKTNTLELTVKGKPYKCILGGNSADTTTVRTQALYDCPEYKIIFNSNIYTGYKKLNWHLNSSQYMSVEHLVNMTALFDIYMAKKIETKLMCFQSTYINRL